MRRHHLISMLPGFCMFFQVTGQILISEPALPVANKAVTVYYDATLGSAGLKDFSGEVYAHTGVRTDKSSDGSDWRYVKTSWGVNTPDTRMTRVSENLYSLEISPSIRTYYGVPQSETITHMAFVFRSSDSSKEGKDDGGTDIFLEVFPEGLEVDVIQPSKNLVAGPGDSLFFEAASSEEADLTLYLDGAMILSVTGTAITYLFGWDTPGDYWIVVSAESTADFASDSVFVHVMDNEVNEPVPEGVEDGINYQDNRTVQLVLFAPHKEHVFVVGDFNNWTPRSDARMTRDGDRFWLTISDLEPGLEYGFQYLVDGDILIADPYTEKTLDPASDAWIPEETYPGLKPYPSGKTTGIAGIIQTGREEYAWATAGFTPPLTEDLVVYELLVRDFIQDHSWKTMTDTLGYLENLGINAIELMPVNEFEGNESWGYNPSFYFAPDKYYGPASDLKVFIDSCHARGIAVIIDMVLNHSYGQSPLVQLYFDNSSGKVSSENPWYNVDSPNPVFAWGYDFNHESQATRDFIDRVNRFWLEEFRVDGFRFDFTKGFTNTPGDGGAYDASRIAILKRMADAIWSVDEDALVILEHLADNNEEKELSNHGMLLWGNANYNYNEATMGYHDNGKSDFKWISYRNRGWNDPHLVGYMESHDEERLMFKNLTFGNSSGSYQIKTLETALRRMELAGAFFFTVPGPKMIWQFGELGYDVSIDAGCRVCNKPIRWDYFDDTDRKRLYQVWAALIRLRTTEPAFESADFSLSVAGPAKRIEINDPDMIIRIIGNFDVSPQQVQPSFTRTGRWYDFFSGDSIQVTDLDQTMSLLPGEFRIYSTSRILPPAITAGIFEPSPGTTEGDLVVYPNPFCNMLTLNPVEEETGIFIVNLRGEVVCETSMSNMQTRLDLSSLTNGFYFLTRTFEKGPPVHTKILKLK